MLAPTEPQADTLLTLDAADRWLRWRFLLSEDEPRRLLLDAIERARLTLRDHSGAAIGGELRVAERAIRPRSLAERGQWAVCAAETRDPVTLAWAPVDHPRVAWGDVRAIAAARWRARTLPPDGDDVPPGAWCDLGEALDRCAGLVPEAGRGRSDRRMLALAALAIGLGMVPLVQRVRRGAPVEPVVMGEHESAADDWPGVMERGTAGSDMLMRGAFYLRAWSLDADGPRPRGLRIVTGLEVPAPPLAAALRELCADPSRLPECLRREGARMVEVDAGAALVPSAASGAPASHPEPLALEGLRMGPRCDPLSERAQSLIRVQAEALRSNGKILTQTQAQEKVEPDGPKGRWSGPWAEVRRHRPELILARKRPRGAGTKSTN